MIRYILAGLLLGAAHGMTVPVRSEPTKGYFTMDAMGCMLLLECCLLYTSDAADEL